MELLVHWFSPRASGISSRISLQLPAPWRKKRRNQSPTDCLLIPFKKRRNHTFRRVLSYLNLNANHGSRENGNMHLSRQIERKEERKCRGISTASRCFLNRVFDFSALGIRLSKIYSRVLPRWSCFLSTFLSASVSIFALLRRLKSSRICRSPRNCSGKIRPGVFSLRFPSDFRACPL